MNLPINEREAQALLSALENYLPELEHGLSRVKLERDRHDLAQRDDILRALQNRLRGVLRESEVS